jgi:hypothetical protein
LVVHGVPRSAGGHLLLTVPPHAEETWRRWTQLTVIVNAADAGELAEMLKFFSEWLARGCAVLAPPDRVRRPPCIQPGRTARRRGAIRLLLGGSNGEQLFGHHQ